MSSLEDQQNLNSIKVDHNIPNDGFEGKGYILGRGDGDGKPELKRKMNCDSPILGDEQQSVGSSLGNGNGNGDGNGNGELELPGCSRNASRLRSTPRTPKKGHHRVKFHRSKVQRRNSKEVLFAKNKPKEEKKKKKKRVKVTPEKSDKDQPKGSK